MQSDEVVYGRPVSTVSYQGGEALVVEKAIQVLGYTQQGPMGPAGRTWAGLSSGSGNAYALTPSPVVLTTGLTLDWQADRANTGAATLDAGDGSGPHAIQFGAQALTSGQIALQQVITTVWDGSAWQLQGGGGTGSTYVHNQGVASALWTITHNLNRFPSVTVVDSLGRVGEGDLAYVSANQLTIQFAGAFSGKAYLN